ncbi:carboxymuconolactone decarboxylase family protein [soil metagenome]
MSVRGSYQNAKSFKGLMALSGAVNNSGIDPIIYELIKLRGSQINGCAFCIDMHINDALALGETQQRINVVSVWRDTGFFTERERAALALTEAVTLIADHHVSDEIFDEARRLFSEDEVADLVMAIVVINAWNRANITFGITLQPEPALA